MGRLDGKVALISGGARGQGATEAKLFVREGAKVVFGDILDQEGRAVEAEIRDSGGEATYLHMDVSIEGDWQRAVSTTVSTYSRLDILVSNAGILSLKGIEETSEEEWDHLMAVNAKGVFFGTKHALPAMRKAGGGSIVVISSTAGLVGTGPAAYTASKGAVRLFSKMTAVKHAKENIRCNCVIPGTLDTLINQEIFADPAMREERGKRIPLGRIGLPKDVAYGVLYLASDESSFVTGAELVIDGGTTAQ